MTDDQIKLARASKAIDGLMKLVIKEPSLKANEDFVFAGDVQAVLTGKAEMPDHWREVQ